MTAGISCNAGAAVIAIDWGTSNFRAFRLDEHGGVVDRRVSARGVLRVAQSQFAEALSQEIGDWLAQNERTVLLCGMVGSRHGWIETEYLACPVTSTELAHHLVEVPFPDARVRIVPGVESCAHGMPEIMRGEETATIGCMNAMHGEGLVCLPGTHSKWVTVRNGAIQGFTTSMTGEVFAALRDHTILAQLMDRPAAPEPDLEAFRAGVACSGQAGGLLHHLFSVRTLALKGSLNPDASSSYLSGVLIGHEVRSAMPPAAEIRLAGTTNLCRLYSEAIHTFGGTATLEHPDAAAHGLALIGDVLRREGKVAW